MIPKGDSPFNFKIDKELYLIVNKSDLIRGLHDKFALIIAPSDIKILDDGIKLQFSIGAHNHTISSLTFKKITEYFTTEGIHDIKYDDQIFKIWLFCDKDYLFVDSGDERLALATAGVDAPVGTIQVDLGEGKIYTMVRVKNLQQMNEAIDVCMTLVDKKLETVSRDGSHKVVDRRIQHLRQKYSIVGGRYNDYISDSTPKIKKIIVHI